MNSSRKSTFAILIALVALVAAVSGSALALPGKNSVKKGDIAKNAVTSKQIKNNSVTGNDVNEASLGKVPAAAAADSAANGAVRIHYTGAVGGPVTTIYSAGGLVIKASCVSAVDLVLTMESTVNNAAVFADSHDHDGSGNADGDTLDTYPQQGDFDAGQPVRIDDDQLHSDDGQGVEINYSNPNGTEVFVKLQNWLASGVSGAPSACFVGGVGFVA